MAQVTRRLRKWADDRGAELIELAIVLPLLLLVFAAIIDFGFLFQRFEVLTNAAREGARIAVLDGYDEADVDARVLSYLQAAGITVVGDPTSVTYATDTLAGGTTISVVTVGVAYPIEFLNLGPIASLIGGSGWSSMTLRASSTMRMELQAVTGS